MSKARAGFLSCWPVRAAFIFLAMLPTSVVSLAAGPSLAGPALPDASTVADPKAVYTVLVVLGALVLLALSIWEKARPKPPFNERYAPAKHSHPELVSLEHFHRVRNNQHDERKRIEAKVDHLSERTADALNKSENELYREIKDVDQRVIRRVDPLSTGIAANKQAINQHLNDHLHGRTS